MWGCAQAVYAQCYMYVCYAVRFKVREASGHHTRVLSIRMVLELLGALFGLVRGLDGEYYHMTSFAGVGFWLVCLVTKNQVWKYIHPGSPPIPPHSGAAADRAGGGSMGCGFR